jgi:hypothetical protein
MAAGARRRSMLVLDRSEPGHGRPGRAVALAVGFSPDHQSGQTPGRLSLPLKGGVFIAPVCNAPACEREGDVRTLLDLVIVDRLSFF